MDNGGAGRGPWQGDPGWQGGPPWQGGPWQGGPWQGGPPHQGGPAARGVSPDALPKIALGVCAVGLVGLLLPFVSSPIGISLSLFSLSPGLATVLLLLFLAISGMPVADIRTRHVRLTPFLVIPGAVGVLAALVLLAGFSASSSSDGLAGLAIATGMVTLGSGAIVMMLAAVGLVVVGGYGFVLQSRRTGRPRGGHAPGTPSPFPSEPPYRAGGPAAPRGPGSPPERW